MAYNNQYGLCDATYIKDNSEIYINVEDKFIEPIIIRVQNIYIQDLISSNLYKTIMDAYALYLNTGTTIATRLSDLVDNYILPTIVHYTIYSIIEKSWIKITPQGVLKAKGTENGDSLTIEEKNSTKETLLSDAQFYGSRLTNYLINNTNIYPEFLNFTSQDDIQATTNNYSNFSSYNSSGRFKNPYCCDED